MFIIKVYKIINMKGVYPLRTWHLQYVSELPYVFNDKPENVCNQLNEIFKDNFHHVIDNV